MIAEGDANANFHTSAPNFYTGKLASVNKDFDYFTNAFNDTQKGEKLTLTLNGNAPVVTSTQEYDLSPNAPDMLFNITTSGKKFQPVSEPLKPIDGATQHNVLAIAQGTGEFGVSQASTSTSSFLHLAPRNLFANLNSLSTFGINELREIEKLQQRRELDLVAGTRYYEIVDNYFDVKNTLAELDYPQMVSYSQGSLEISQVVQTSASSSTAANTPQANVAGYAVDVAGHGMTNVSLMEHSLIIPFMFITQRHTYQQGLNRFYSRKDKTDFFDPLQIGLGFQPIYKSEIYGHLKDSERNDV